MKIKRLNNRSLEWETIETRKKFEIELDNGKIFHIKEENGELIINSPKGKIRMFPCVTNEISFNIEYK
jgi:hypothetical protein